jgi:hypothetical protein
MKTIPANELPELDPHQVQLDALTGGAGRRISVRFGNDLWTLACPAERPQGAPETTLALLLGGEPAELEFSFAPGGKLFERHAEYRLSTPPWKFPSPTPRSPRLPSLSTSTSKTANAKAAARSASVPLRWR